jgi:hypothetical protein
MDAPLLCPCEFQLVLRHNPEPGELVGREVEPETLADIVTGLAKRFGGYTPLGLAGERGLPGGAWEGQVEPSLRIEVAVLPERVREVEQYVHEIGTRLKQKCMYFKVGPPCVKILQIDDCKGKAAEGGK